MTPGRNDYGLPTGLKSNSGRKKIEKKIDPKNLPVVDKASHVPDGDVLSEVEGTNMFPPGTQDKVKKLLDRGTEFMKKNPIGRALGTVFGSSNKGSNYTPKGKVVPEGTSYGLYKGDGKPKGPMAKFADAKKKKKETVKEDMKGMSQKSGDKRSTESGAGMTAKGVAKYNRRTGGNLKTAVTTPPSKLKPGSKAAKRRKSFCARSKSWDGPRGKAARRRWNCEYEPELPMIPEEKKKDKALELVKKSIIAKYGKNAIMKRGQPKKVRGAKSTAGTGKYKKMADDKKQLKKDAKEMGYGSNTKGYVETRARYGSKENMKKGRGLGT